MVKPSPLRYNYLSNQALRNLDNHKYSCDDPSILSKYVFQPWWEWVVRQLPENLAPNTCTVFGLVFMCLPSALLVWHCPTGKGNPPPWVVVSVAISTFVYQTLDAIDGKQARRLKAGSPLGELCDHGCDAVSTWFSLLALGVSLQLEVNWTCFCIFWGLLAFYGAHFQTYNTGALQFGSIDVTEAQVVIITIHLLSAYFGHDMWTTNVAGMSLNHLILIPTCLCTLNSVGRNVYNSFKTLSTGKPEKVAHTPTLTSILIPLLPCAVLHSCAAWLLFHPLSRPAVSAAPWAFVALWGLLNAQLVMLIIVHHMTQIQLHSLTVLWNLPMILPVLNTLFPVVPASTALGAGLLAATIIFVHFTTCVSLQLCEWGRIRFFHVSTWKPRSQE